MPRPNSEPAFDPKPFIRTFEGAVDKLLVLRRGLQKTTDEMETTVKSAERDYSKRMGELNSSFEVSQWCDSELWV